MWDTLLDYFEWEKDSAIHKALSIPIREDFPLKEADKDKGEKVETDKQKKQD